MPGFRFSLSLLFLAILTAGLLFPARGNAQTVHTSSLNVATGNWSAPGSWSHSPAFGGYPDNTDSDVFNVTLGNAGTVTLDVSATIDTGRIHEAGFLNPLVLTFQQTKPDAAPYLILHSLIENQTGHAWDAMSFKVLQNPLVTFDVQDTANGGSGAAPYNTVLLDPTGRILSFSDGVLGNTQTFTTDSKTSPLLVAANPTSNTANGVFSLKIGADMDPAHMPEPGS
jgi:hypothetical protein